MWKTFKEFWLPPLSVLVGFALIGTAMIFGLNWLSDVKSAEIIEKYKMHPVEQDVEAKVQEVEMGAGVVQVFTYEGHIYPLAKFSHGAYVPSTRILFNALKNNAGDYSFDIKYYIMKELDNGQGKESN